MKINKLAQKYTYQDKMENDVPNAGNNVDSDNKTDFDFNDPRIQSYIKQQTDLAVNNEVTGLKNKNSELLGKLQKYGDTTPEQLNQIMNVLNSNEEAKLLANGKIDEVIAKRTDRMQAEYNDKISELNNKLQETSESSAKYKNMFTDKLIQDQIRNKAIETGARPEALDDILRRATEKFSLASDGTLEARSENGELIYDDNKMLLTPERFLNNLKDTTPYYWPDSQGAGANGNTGNNSYNNPKVNVSDLNNFVAEGSNFNLDDYRVKRKKMSGEDYNKNKGFTFKR